MGGSFDPEGTPYMASRLMRTSETLTLAGLPSKVKL
jgi:hypothetical protein